MNSASANTPTVDDSQLRWMNSDDSPVVKSTGGKKRGRKSLKSKQGVSPAGATSSLAGNEEQTTTEEQNEDDEGAARMKKFQVGINIVIHLVTH